MKQPSSAAGRAPSPPHRSNEQPARLERSRLSNRAADALKRRIVTGTYPAGARLPTEKDLAAELGVTRLTVREALSQLSAAGFVETRHGSGTYALDLGERVNLQLLAEMLNAGRALSAAESASLMELRARLLSAFADVFVERATAEHVTELRAVVEAMRATLGAPGELAEQDYRFNEVLARATGNFFLVLLMRSLREVHLRLGEVVYREHGDVEAILATQSALIDAIERRQSARVSKVLRTYLEGATEVVTGWLSRRDRAMPR